MEFQADNLLSNGPEGKKIIHIIQLFCELLGIAIFLSIKIKYIESPKKKNRKNYRCNNNKTPR